MGLASDSTLVKLGIDSIEPASFFSQVIAGVFGNPSAAMTNIQVATCQQDMPGDDQRSVVCRRHCGNCVAAISEEVG